MTISSAQPRKNRAPLNLAMGLVGLLAMIVLIAGSAIDGLSVTRIPAALLMIAALAVMFFTRKSDEYTSGLWSSGANAAFAVIVFGFVFAPFLEGVVDGFNQAHDGSEASLDMPLAAVSYLAIFVFFLTFNIKRLTGAL